MFLLLEHHTIRLATGTAKTDMKVWQHACAITMTHSTICHCEHPCLCVYMGCQMSWQRSLHTPSRCSFNHLLVLALLGLWVEFGNESHSVYILLGSFRLMFTLNGDWSCDHKNDINVHRKKLTAKVILDHRKSPWTGVLQKVCMFLRNCVIVLFIPSSMLLTMTPYKRMFGLWLKLF